MTSRPVLGTPYISAWKEMPVATNPKFNATRFSVDCIIGYPKQGVDDGVRFDVVFQMGDTRVYETQANSTETVVTMDESYLAGHIGKTVRIFKSGFVMRRCFFKSYVWPNSSSKQINSNAAIILLCYVWFAIVLNQFEAVEGWLFLCWNEACKFRELRLAYVSERLQQRNHTSKSHIMVFLSKESRLYEEFNGIWIKVRLELQGISKQNETYL